MKLKLLSLMMFVPLFLLAQTTREEVEGNILFTGGNYYSYPTPIGNLTQAPDGYKPFYISHYGRHGSRYMINDKPYLYVIEKMNKAESQNALTILGKETLKKLNIAYNDAKNRDGELSKLGARQHREIANRMYNNFSELFSLPIEIEARSSTVMRCALSMSNFCQQLRALNPDLKISMDASKHDMWYIANGSKDVQKVESDTIMLNALNDFKKNHFHPDRLMATLFSDENFAKKEIDAVKMLVNLYNIAEDMQCFPELDLSFIDLFTKEELFDIWQCYNADWCYGNGFFSTTTPRYKSQYNLLRNILNTADSVIASGKPAVTLRFGHDSMVSPLAYVFHLNNCDNVPDNLDELYLYWTDFKIIPMAGNIQIIFYRKSENNDILVKFLLNEHETSIPIKTDCAPYYHWKDVEAFYRTELSK